MRSRAKVATFSAVLFAIVIGFMVVFSVAKPKAVLVLKGSYDPRSTFVTSGDTLLDPRGKDGREFEVLGVGKKTVVINGPLLETASLDVSVPIFGTRKTEVEVKPVTLDILIQTQLEQKDAVVTKAKAFSSSWVVGYVSGAANGNEDDTMGHAVFLFFDRKTDKWLQITPDTVGLLEAAPKEARNYYESLLED